MEQNNKPWLDGVNEWMKKLVPNGELLFESGVDETGRRQKAQQAIVGQNHRIKTMAIISPENPMGRKSSKEYNDKSMEEMINSLKIGHFKWFKVNGLYNDPENSLIIYNISLDDTLYLCYKFNQESVVFVDMTSSDGKISYQYWEGDDHNSTLKLQKERNEIVDAQNDSDYYTEICRFFKFRIPFFEHFEHINAVLYENSEKYDVDRLLNESMNDKFTGHHKYICRAKIYGDNKSKLTEIQKRHKKGYRINEGVWETDMSGWINIGVVKNGSNIGEGGDAYLMVDPKYPKTDDFSTFAYRGTGYNTKPDGTGFELQLTEHEKQHLRIYDQYRDTYYGEVFLGHKKTEEQKQKHELFMSELDMSGDMVVLKHDSSYKIKDGIIRNGTPNGWSNNSDIGIYFWGSKQHGSDQSNGGLYTYYCLVNRNFIYDFENDMERFGTLLNAFNRFRYVAQYWKGGPSIVVNSITPVPISYIKDNHNGKIYDANWNELRK